MNNRHNQYQDNNNQQNSNALPPAQPVLGRNGNFETIRLVDDKKEEQPQVPLSNQRPPRHPHTPRENSNAIPSSGEEKKEEKTQEEQSSPVRSNNSLRLRLFSRNQLPTHHPEQPHETVTAPAENQIARRGPRRPGGLGSHRNITIIVG